MVDRGVLLGDVITGTGVLHLALGVVMFQEPLRGMLGDGLVDSVGAFVDRDNALWFLVSGGFLLTSGLTVRWLKKVHGVVPTPLGWGLVVISVLGAAVEPLSGFWLVLVEGVLLVRSGRDQRAPGSMTEVAGVRAR